MSKYVSYSTALKLKKLNFDDPCWTHFGNKKEGFDELRPSDNCKNSVLEKLNWTAAPTYDQVFTWLRKKHKLNCYVTRDGGWWISNIQDFSREDEDSPDDINIIEVLPKELSVCSNKYTEAQELCIKAALKLIK